MTANPIVYIIIPVFNRIRDTLRCLSSLRSQDYPHFSIIVIDDGSTDGTEKSIRNNFPEVKMLNGDGNYWWTKSTNLGIRYALSVCNSKDLILTLNNDLEVQSNYLSSLIKTHKKWPNSLVGSLAVFIDKPSLISYSGERWNRYLAKRRPNYRIGTRLKNIHCEVISTDTLPGRGMLIPSDVFNKIGLFDERHLPQYGADFDFSLRAKEAGYKLIVSRDATIHSDTENKGYETKNYNNEIANYVKSRFTKKSHRWIVSRFWIGAKHLPRYYLPIYLLLDEIRVTGSFVRSLFSSKNIS